MNQIEKFFNWLRKDNWYKHGSADALICRIQHIGKVLGKTIYELEKSEIDNIRIEILDSKIFSSLDTKQKDEYGVSLSRYSDFCSY